jgi:hypothetical protein
MEIAESDYLATEFEQPLLDFQVFQISLLIEYFPSFRNGDLLWNNPGVERTADCSQMTERVNCAESTAGNANEAKHLSFKFLKTHQVESVLQDTAHPAVILRSS